MAQLVSIRFTDDLDGESEAQHSVAFALDGCAYEIDLSDEHVVEMRAALEPYLLAARPVR